MADVKMNTLFIQLSGGQYIGVRLPEVVAKNIIENWAQGKYEPNSIIHELDFWFAAQVSAIQGMYRAAVSQTPAERIAAAMEKCAHDGDEGDEWKTSE